MKGTLLHRAWYGLVWLLTLLFLFYSVEGWRGKRAWREYEQRMRHQGEWEAWKDLLPVPVPASNNVMATPPLNKLYRTLAAPYHPSESFFGRFEPNPLVDLGDWNALQVELWEPRLERRHARPSEAILEWFETQRIGDLYLASLKEHSQFIQGYDEPWSDVAPDFAAFRIISQGVTLHARAALAESRPDLALKDVRVLFKVMEAFLQEPNLVGVMVGVAIGGLGMEVVEEGIRRGAWRAEHHSELHRLLLSRDIHTRVAWALRAEQAGLIELATRSPERFRELISGVNSGRPNRMVQLQWKLLPEGWIHQNLLRYSQGMQEMIASVRVEDRRSANHSKPWEQGSPVYNYLARVAIPNFRTAIATASKLENRFRMAAIAMALERYRLRHGIYPESLSQAEKSLPEDLLEQAPFRYRRLSPEHYQIWSPGWDGTDEGGEEGKDWVLKR